MKFINALEYKFKELDNKIKSYNDLVRYTSLIVNGIIGGNYDKSKVMLFKLWLKDRFNINLERVIKNSL